MLSPWTIAAWAVLIVLVGVGMAVWLLLAYTSGNADANRAELDAIRTSGTIVVGTGGAAALLLAARRQRTVEIALAQKDHDQADVARAHAHQVQVAEQTRRHQERVAAATEADAEARRITDLYTKAVEQLGSDKAPVRLGGLYALERLAQDNRGQRQTIVNMLCAYLRMPFTLPGAPPADTADDKLIATHRDRIQEREVRVTAQRILAHHLRPGDDPDHPVATFWADIDLDLTGATLIDLFLDYCTIRDVRFNQATFIGVTWFNEATLTGNAYFDHATFIHNAHFDGTTFTGLARFSGATFAGGAGFRGATFTGGAWFRRATFTSGAGFTQATFVGFARFHHATFTSDAGFNSATFAGIADFSAATLPSTRFLDSDTPSPFTNFAGARFSQGVPPEVTQFVPSPNEANGEDGNPPLTTP